MSQEKLKMGNSFDVKEAIPICNERTLVYAKKIEMHLKRKAFSKQNVTFELYRRRFYRNLEEAKVVEHQMPVKEIKNFWETMWNKGGDENTGAGLDKYLVEHLSGEEPLNVVKLYNEYIKLLNKYP